VPLLVLARARARSASLIHRSPGGATLTSRASGGAPSDVGSGVGARVGNRSPTTCSTAPSRPSLRSMLSSVRSHGDAWRAVRTRASARKVRLSRFASKSTALSAKPAAPNAMGRMRKTHAAAVTMKMWRVRVVRTRAVAPSMSTELLGGRVRAARRRMSLVALASLPGLASLPSLSLRSAVANTSRARVSCSSAVEAVVDVSWPSSSATDRRSANSSAFIPTREESIVPSVTPGLPR